MNDQLLDAKKGCASMDETKKWKGNVAVPPQILKLA